MPTRGLYAILNTADLRAEQRLTATNAVLAGGAVMLQYRHKPRPGEAAPVGEVQTLARACNEYGCPLIVNDNIELARAGAAHGVHLGQADAGVAQARQRLGAGAIIGVTCHDSLAAARAAAGAGADYVSFGRFFHSRTKPQASPAPVAILTAARREIDLPIVAIGGVNADNGAALIEAGADLLACAGAVFAGNHIRTTARAMARLFELGQG